MKVKLNLNEIDLQDPKQIALFQLLCSLSTTRTCLGLYMGEEAGRANLSSQDDIIMLAMALAGIGETLHKFEELVSKGVIQKAINCDSVLAEAWVFIESQAIKELKKTNLKYIRDKSAFHFDPEPIKEFFTESMKETNEIDLWETSEQDKHGFSPLASLIISNTLINVTKPDKERAELSMKVYGALSTIVLYEINEHYNLNAIQ
ncbi:hypothetical protein GXP70_16025 [Paenibacillus lycopersici]|uniref:Uncharacterized protein n=1 Tax=Paenibacillus lycopersici TaxID=2704462 RepID=A0A6C0G6K4_9BACL|nr:hypothetical protein [Paenibacillus lycopersici]QHT61315.1 hypothetical protein GXP70_16025 [Paenibacillus lycopersici]